MLIIIGLIIIGITIFFEYKHYKNEYQSWEMSRFFTVPLLTVWFGFLLFIIDCVISGRIIDNKIELYQNQNEKIEEKIELVVKNYMGYENDIFKDLKSDSYITLVTTYPELKSDELVKKQIELYYENNNKIVELKEDKINLTIDKWWLYFGK